MSRNYYSVMDLVMKPKFDFLTAWFLIMYERVRKISSKYPSYWKKLYRHILYFTKRFIFISTYMFFQVWWIIYLAYFSLQKEYILYQSLKEQSFTKKLYILTPYKDSIIITFKSTFPVINICLCPVSENTELRVCVNKK